VPADRVEAQLRGSLAGRANEDRQAGEHVFEHRDAVLYGAADPVHQRDVQRRWMDWIAQHFGLSSPTAAR
jgi:hypothetical protein